VIYFTAYILENRNCYAEKDKRKPLAFQMLSHNSMLSIYTPPEAVA